jgi:hypothetical protein
MPASLNAGLMLTKLSPSPSSSLSPSRSPAPAPALGARFLTTGDIPALLRLEARQWDAEQSADASAMCRRIKAYPELCVGSFCARTGEALASLFMKPIHPDDVMRADSWYDCADSAPRPRTSSTTRSLFGISLTSTDGAAAWALIRFFWPHALKNGWREIYLGSPLPGLARALRDEPALSPDTYARMTRRGLPLDPQLRYYHRRGFKQLVAVKPDYFPHAASLDHGAVLRGVIPLSNLGPLWRRMPMSTLQAMSGLVSQLLTGSRAA